MRILLLGGTGLLSGAAVRVFLDAGHELTVLTRGERPLESHPRLAAVRADRTESESLRAALAGERFDFTADFLAYQARDVDSLLAVPGFTPGRMAMISSGQVYLVTSAPHPPFREADAERPLMPEPATGTRDHREWSYGIGKRGAEAALIAGASARGVAALALRLPVVQGEADAVASRRLWAWLERLRDGGPVLLPEAGVQRVRFVHADDVAAALLALAESSAWPAAPALNLAQPDEPTLREFLDAVADIAGVTPRWVPVSAAALVEAGLAETCAPYWGRWCSRPDTALAMTLLGVRPRASAVYLPSVVHAHLAGPPPAPHPGYALRAEEEALAARLTS